MAHTGMRNLVPKVLRTCRLVPLAAFGALITVGCLLRFWKLTAVGLWYDELWTVVGASDRPFMEMYREWIVGDSHPPGLFLFYFAWFKIFPNTEFWARIPSAVAGAVMVLYLLFRTGNVLTRDERIMSASFASLSYICIFYALSVKQYSPMMLFATVATTAYLGIVTTGRVDRRTGITLCAACIVLSYLNHFAMVYAWMLLALLALTFRRQREARQRILRIAAAVGLAYLPIVYFLYLQLAYSIDAWQPYNIKAFLSGLLLSIFFDDSNYLSWELGGLFSAVLVLVLARGRIRDLAGSTRNRHVVVIVSAFCAFMLLLGISKPIFYARYFLVILPVAFVGLGIVTAAAFPLTRTWLVVLPLAFFSRAAVAQFRAVDALQRQQWDKSVDLVLEWKKPDEPVYVLGAKMDRTEFEYLQQGDPDGVFYVRNVRFYEYYFKRRGAFDVASKLQVVQPTVASATELAARYRRSGVTVYVLAGHHLQYSDDALEALRKIARRIEITPLHSTLVYRLTF